MPSIKRLKILPGKPAVVALNPSHPDGMPPAIERGAACIQQGGMVVFPTRCLYGLAVDAFNIKAVSRIFTVKRRSRTKPLLVLIPDPSHLDKLVAGISSSARAIMDRFWPGDVTLVFQGSPDLPDLLTAGTGKIGVRLPQHPVARALVTAAAIPVTGTSANLSGEKGCFDISDLDTSLLQSVELVLNAGPLQGGRGSTVVDVTCTPPRVLRQGSVTTHEILRCVSGLC